MSTATIKLFPSLASKTDSKIVIQIVLHEYCIYINISIHIQLCFFSQANLFDKSKRSGLLYEKIRYNQRKNKPKTKPPTKTLKNNVNDGDIVELTAFFESCVLPRDKQLLSDKLKSSVAVRKASIETTRDVFDKSYHLYQIDSDLVSN